ncbi:MAG: FIG022979: MoxR-like ATPases, partial [uncultured Friedmanniella sp.]
EPELREDRPRRRDDVLPRRRRQRHGGGQVGHRGGDRGQAELGRPGSGRPAGRGAPAGGGRARGRQDHAGQGSRTLHRLLGPAGAVHPGPAALRHHGRLDLQPGDPRLRVQARWDLRQHRGGRRDQPRLTQDPVGAAGVHGGTPGQRGRHHLPAGSPLHGGGHPEPDRDGRHLPPSRGAARPLHGSDPDGLPDSQRRAGHARLARHLRPAGGDGAGDRRRDAPRSDRGGEDGLRQPRRQAVPGAGRQRDAELPRPPAGGLPPGDLAAAASEPGLRRAGRPGLRDPRRRRRTRGCRAGPPGAALDRRPAGPADRDRHHRPGHLRGAPPGSAL